MKITEHIDAIQHEGQLLAGAATQTELDAWIPTCPDWRMRDLVRHVGGVHRWATGYVGDRRSEMWDVDLDDIVGTWPADLDLIDWFREGYTKLVHTLASALTAIEISWNCGEKMSRSVGMQRKKAELSWGLIFQPFVLDGIGGSSGKYANAERLYLWFNESEEQTTIEEWKALTAKILVVSDKSTRLPIREIVDIFVQACPHWSFRFTTDGGHMASLTRPDLINPIVREFLDGGSA